MTPARIELAGVGVQYGRDHWAVRDVDLLVPAGSVMGVVGESGSGKSTMARAMVGLVPMVTGRVLLDGEQVRPRGRGARPMQMVFQDPSSALDPRMTVGEAVAEGLGSSKMSKAQRNIKVGELLELVHLAPELATRFPSGLSGGQRQRVSLARALAAQPRVLIADEVTSALDVSVQGAVLNQLRSINQDLGITMLFISHNLAVVAYMSDYITVMRQGRVVESQPAADLLERPREDYTRSLLEAVPVLGQRFLEAHTT